MNLPQTDMTGGAQLTAGKIKKKVDSAIRDFVEGNQTIGQLVSRIRMYNNSDVFNTLHKAKYTEYTELIYLIDLISSAPYDNFYEVTSALLLRDRLKAYYLKLKQKKKITISITHGQRVWVIHLHSCQLV